MVDVLRTAAVALALGCGLPAGARAEAPAEARPGFAVKGFTPGEADASGATLAFDAELSNPTAGPVALAGVTFALEIAGKRVVEGRVPGGREAAGGSAVAFTFPARLGYAELPMLAVKTALGLQVPFRLLATAEIRTPLGLLAVPVVYDGALSAPRPPGAGLAGFRILSMNPFDAAVEVRVGLENENAFPLPAGLLRYRITIAGADVSAAEAPIPALAPRAKAVVAIPVQLSLRKAGRGVVSALKSDSAVVGLHATASLGALAWPVDLEARFPTRP